MYFERVDWLAVAMKEAGVMINGEQLMEIQDTLFSIYLEEIVYGHFQIDSHFDLPPISLMRPDSEDLKSVIASLNKILSEVTPQ
jgi:predicted DNA-binding transcriptional regulator YafY